jgi:endo-1,4-beta-xylanase
MGTTHGGGTQYCTNSYGNVGNGYVYQLWSDGTGSACMTTYGVDATFKANWSNVGDVLVRAGLAWSSTQTYDQLGTVAADYAYMKTGSGSTFSYIGIYGWSLDPMIEYYITDDWYGNSPPTGQGTLQGTFSVDGGTYDVYTHQQVDKPSVTGMNATFMQYFSVRQTPRQCGHISITEHYKKWASLGMPLGKMVEAKLLAEVGGGTGSIDYTYATVTAK